MPPEMICRACGKVVIQRHPGRVMVTCNNTCRLVANRASLGRFMKMPVGKYHPKKKA